MAQTRTEATEDGRQDVPRPIDATAPHRRPLPGAGLVWGVTRLLLGWVFLWAFLDKLFGLGFATCRAEEGSSIDYLCDAAFVNGGSPTYGFLEFGTQGSHTGGLLGWLASSGPDSQNAVDWLFMAALGGVGIALMLGVLMRLASVAGALLLMFMYLAGFVWPENNPVVDDHIVYAVVLIGLMLAGAGDHLGLGARWRRLDVVRRYPILE